MVEPAGPADPTENSPREVVVGLLADPDLPATLARELARTLPAELRAAVGPEVRWSVERVRDPFEAMFPDSQRLVDKARQRVRDTNWDLAVCLTDLPLLDDGGVTAVKISRADRVALVSLPSLGGVLLHRRLRDVVVPLVAVLDPAVSADPAGQLRRVGLEPVPPGDHEIQGFRRAGPGFVRLLAGMIRANRPWQLVIGLSTALASAVAGSAFGILYSSIWLLATSLGPLRLSAVIVAAIGALAVWLIVNHSLWEHRERSHARSERERRLRNAGTVFTVGAGAIVFFLALCLLTGIAVALVVPPAYLAGSVGHPAGPLDYVKVTLMASVLGTVAGAVGSGLEDDTTVRQATYGYREQARHRLVERESD
ncbi:hypothetical protein FHX82_005155 [Amycolatopsis bartoniae]|nr:hypothetical protein [Amycolatopsis bartoniae]MBB2938079.1 hypothetical protein [Amycolatopsis bartoniae]TVT09915.1 hypothetical protein FNH07_06590 [Amycolatopsis bartoniae]